MILRLCSVSIDDSHFSLLLHTPSQSPHLAEPSNNPHSHRWCCGRHTHRVGTAFRQCPADDLKAVIIRDISGDLPANTCSLGGMRQHHSRYPNVFRDTTSQGHGLGDYALS